MTAIPEEASVLLLSVVRIELEIQSQVQALKQTASTLAEGAALSSDVSEKLKVLGSLMKKIEKTAKEQERDEHTRAILEKLDTHHHQLEHLRSTFRAASLAFHANLKERETLERAQLLRQTVHPPTSPPQSGHASAQQTEGGGDEPGGSSEYRRPSSTAPDSALDLRKRTGLQSSQQKVLSTATSITHSLRSTQQMMTLQLQQSADTLSALSTSSKTIETISAEYQGLTGLISTGKRLIANIRRRELTDNALIVFGLFIFITTVLYILNKRLGSWFY